MVVKGGGLSDFCRRGCLTKRKSSGAGAEPCPGWAADTDAALAELTGAEPLRPSPRPGPRAHFAWPVPALPDGSRPTPYSLDHSDLEVKITH